MRNASLDRYRKELFHQFAASPDHFHAKLGNRLGFQHTGQQENTPTLAAKGCHERTVVELAYHAGVNLVAGEPAFQLLAHRGGCALDQHGGIRQTLWKITFKLGFKQGCAEETHGRAAQQVVEGLDTDAP